MKKTKKRGFTTDKCSTFAVVNFNTKTFIKDVNFKR